MYVLASIPSSWWPVIWSGVTEEGEIIENRIEMKMRRLDSASFEDFNGKVADLKDMAVAALILDEEIVTDWRGIVDEKKRPVPFGREIFSGLFRDPVFAQAVGIAIARLTWVQKDEREKNSAPSPAPMPGAESSTPGA